MIASTRLVNIGRTVMPYASWAAYAIQLGYVGYNLYHYYQEYLAQVERDQRSNTQRALNETIELVVAPRRRRDKQQQQQQQTTTIQEQQPQQTQTQTQQEANVSVGATEERDQQRDAALLLVENNIDLHDTRESDQEISQAEQQQQQQIQTPDRLSATTDVGRVEPPSGSSQIEVITIEDDDDDNDEILSDGDASISLESTDSNRGIINDMYSECFICARTLNDPNKQVATLPFCLHPFHKTCLDGVLQWHRKCPVCDFNIFSPI